MIQELTTGLLGLVLIAYAAELLLSARDDPKEPPRLYSKVPLIGHVLGLIRHGPPYHSLLSNTTNSDVYSLGILNTKLYTGISTRLLPAIQRQSKTLSFHPMILMLAKRWGDASDATLATFEDPHFVPAFSAVTRAYLAPGPHLNDQNERMGKRALAELEYLLGESKGAKQQQQQQQKKKQGVVRQVWMLEWAKHAIVQASSCSVYGTKHPFVDPEVEDAFWKWQSFLPAHLAGSHFDVFGTGFAARQKVFDAHVKYCRDMPEDASALIRERWRALIEAGIDETDAAKQQTTLAIGMLGSTVPTFYWTIWELFSRPEVLYRVRQELEDKAVSRLPPEADASFALDVAALKSQCPLLLSMYQETQRIRHVHAITRKVTEDSLLDDGKYLLKKGNYFQMPGNAIHHNTDIWGPSAAEFDPDRFVNPETKRTGSDFLAWGAPPHMCPARQFAATEILVFVALMAMRADLQPASGVWEKNPALATSDPITVLNPKKDVLMNVRVREEWAGEWKLLMSDSKVRVPLASG